MMNSNFKIQFMVRPNRSSHMGLVRSLDYANEDYLWVVDMDLEKFFGT